MGSRSDTPPWIALSHDGRILRNKAERAALSEANLTFFYLNDAWLRIRRLQARSLSLGDFIYAQVGYDPRNQVPDAWRQFYDRVSLTYNSVPAGYFSVFKEIADIIVHLGQAGLTIDEKFVPDISVGSHWAKHWTGSKLHEKFGERTKFEHNYPNYSFLPQYPLAYFVSLLHHRTFQLVLTRARL